MNEKEFSVYFRGSLTFKAKDIEDAWEVWFKERDKIKNIIIDDSDIYEENKD